MLFLKRENTSWYLKQFFAYFLFISIITTVLTLKGYGLLAMDTFSRANIGWSWANSPFYLTNDGVWQPLQFIIIGVITKLLWIIGIAANSLIIGIIINNIFSAITFLCLVSLVNKLVGRKAAIFSGMVSVTVPFYVYITYSSVSEPIYISFIMMTIWSIISYVLTMQKKYLLFGSVLVLLASMTHIQGWMFYISFCVVMLILWIKEKRFTVRNTVYYILITILPSVFPISWLYCNYYKWGDPLHFVKATKNYEILKENLSGPRRILELLYTIEIMAPIIGVLFIISLVFIIKNFKVLSRGLKYYILIVAIHSLVFCLPFILRISSINSSFSERRYLVLYILLSIPIVFVFINKLNKKLFITVVTALLLFNVLYIPHYKNPFPNEMYSLSNWISKDLRPQLNGNKILLEKVSYAEQEGIPAFSNMRESFEIINSQNIQENLNKNKEEFLNQFQNVPITFLITSVPETVLAFQSYGSVIKQFGSYVVIELNNHPHLFPDLQPNIYMDLWKPEGKGTVSLMTPDMFFLKFNNQIEENDELSINYYFNVEESKTMNFSVLIYDNYGGDIQDRSIQFISLDGQILNEYNIGNSFNGWREVEVPLRLEKGDHNLKLGIKSLRNQEENWDWAELSSTKIMNLSLNEVTSD